MNEQNIFENDKVTSNSAQLEILKKNFPNCFDKDGHFILDSFKEVIKENDLDFSDESYSLNWLGKSYAQLLRNEKAHTFIQPNHDHNNQEINKNSQNLLIKGDNLEVLKHLRNAYSEKIKMIYIDPPYNTGSDGFIYQDDRKFSKKELMHLAKVSEDEAKRILDFTAKGSNSHSAWLTFIYPRLYIARELLQEDGVIFISIDDNEQAQLKLLCDEIFGEENFLSNIVWEKRFTRSNNSKTFATLTENILCYRKSLSLEIIREPRNAKADSTYSNPDNDPRGIWTSVSYVNPATKEQRPNLAYSLINPFDNSTIIHPTNAWKYEKSTYELHAKDNRLYWGIDGKNKYPRLKRFLSEMDNGMVPVDLWDRKSSSTTDEASKSLELLLNGKYFDFPKPIALIKKALKLSKGNEGVILDFFAGSGTTAHAVMELNAEDNGDRQFILVQIDEATDKKSEAYKAGYQTIFDITKARIEKAGEKIKQVNPEYEGDLGFKIFETAPLPDNYNNEVLELNAESQLEMFDGAKNDEQLLNAILTTWTLYDRIPLTSSLETLLIDDYNAQYSSEYNTLYLMQPNLTTQNIKTLINKIETDPQFVPEKIVIYGFNFDSKIQRELDEALKSYQNKKSLNIDLLVRYY